MNSSSPTSASPRQTLSFVIRRELRELVAALPIVIFANAIRDALQRPQPSRATIKRAIAR